MTRPRDPIGAAPRAPGGGAFAAAALLLVACASPDPDAHSHGAGGHSHGPGGHSHGGGGPDAHGDGPASVARTRWTGTHELFVELDAPVAGAALQVHAHVTRLADNRAAASGSLTLRFEQDGFVVESHTDEGPARPGIFATRATAPSRPGAYRLHLSYRDGDERADWDAGELSVGDGAPLPHPGEEEGEIRFLKESQWQVPFRVAPAEEHPLATVIRATAIARPSPRDTAVVAAPAGGLLVWADELPVPGRRVERGEPLATLLPAGAAEHWTRLQADLTTARIDRDLATDEHARIEALVREELLPARRLAQARAALDRAAARLEAAERRTEALSSGSSRALVIRAPATGTLVAVGAEHGRAVEAGAPLLTVSGTDAVLLDGHVHERTRAELTPLVGLHAERGGWSEPRDLLALGGRLLTERLVFDPWTLSAPVAVEVGGAAGIGPGDVVELVIGVGEPTPTLSVPLGAVVEVNARPTLFVQRTGESFTRRPVRLGRSDGSRVAVSAGLEPGERVVVEGGFDLHVASLQDALESHRH